MDYNAICSCCNKEYEGLTLGYKTIFDEYDYICKSCLDELYQAECEE